MIAGRMMERLRVLRPVSPADELGAYEAGILAGGQAIPARWEEVGVIHAERVRMSGRRSLEVGEQFADLSAQWNIRDTHDVRPNWRVADLRGGGDVYDVVTIIPNRARGMLTLICEKANL